MKQNTMSTPFSADDLATLLEIRAGKLRDGELEPQDAALDVVELLASGDDRIETRRGVGSRGRVNFGVDHAGRDGLVVLLPVDDPTDTEARLESAGGDA